MKEYDCQFPEALYRMFPTVDSFQNFVSEDNDDNRKIRRNLVDIAFKNKHIPDRTEHELCKLINTMSMTRVTPHHEKLSFSDIMDNLAQGASINTLVEWLNYLATDLGFPKIQASMITRMKQSGQFKTSRQQLLLRLIAFWTGLKRPLLPYTFQTFTESFAFALAPAHDVDDEGVRIDFTFLQTVEIIDFQMIDWLKTELLQCIKDLNLFSITGSKISFYSTITASLKIHKDKGPTLEPRLYSQAIRCALVIAHQIIIRWAISSVNRKQNPMVIAIAAGKFSKLSGQIQSLLDARLSEALIVRMSDYAKLCVSVTDAKVVFHPGPLTLTIPNGDIFTLWVIKHFWFLYYDFIPRLLDSDMLPTNDNAYDDFKNLIYFPGSESISSGNHILSAIRKFPQNDILIIETAKICLSRRMFAEANSILMTIFASDPFNPVARTLRMVIFLNMAMAQNDYTVFELYFDRAKKEGDFVLKYCKEEEEIWCEYGLLHWTRAIFILRQLRRQIITDKFRRAELKEILLSDLREAETCFQNGMIFSPTVNRPGFWIVHLKSLYTMVKQDATITESLNPIRDTSGVYASISVNFFISLGWIDPAVLTLTDIDKLLYHLNLFINRIEQGIYTYDGSVNLRMYKPNVAYSIATVMWDFSPIMTIGTAKTVLEWLEKSKMSALRVKDSKTGLFSIVSWYSQIQDPGHFISCVAKAYDQIYSIIESKLHLDNNTVIDNDAINGLKLFPMFFDEDMPSCVIFS